LSAPFYTCFAVPTRILLFHGPPRIRRLCTSGRLHGSYAETAFEEVIESNRRGTWTIDAVTGHVLLSDSIRRLISLFSLARRLHSPERRSR
jgi:hypothetical protein